MGRNIYKLTKNFDDVIKMRQLKSRRFSRVFDEYLKKVQLIFTKLMSFLGNHLQYLLKFKD